MCAIQDAQCTNRPCQQRLDDGSWNEATRTMTVATNDESDLPMVDWTKYPRKHCTLGVEVIDIADTEGHIPKMIVAESTVITSANNQSLFWSYKKILCSVGLNHDHCTECLYVLL